MTNRLRWWIDEWWPLLVIIAAMALLLGVAFSDSEKETQKCRALFAKSVTARDSMLVMAAAPRCANELTKEAP